ncbi:MAG: pyruvate ferredoxin oxidoreductase [Acidilobaceae archaeon]|nr:pyruvate ferredoxin oxidoreductase [Acidilobaceae archaeon]MCX8165767.1 pyruvate ferredoxin oxidoreductase [Acidilobaceae archaeon]MDW7974192.1 pyruvate ferredoxin oxidoreductase [Sulfolobales archaeon]
MKKKILMGSHAVAEAVKLARVDVISAYPITPQTVIVERLAEMVERGELKSRYVRVESEHSALAVVYGASAGGSRVFTATSSHGLLYMYEMLWWVTNSRLPVVMAVATRAIGPPWNIHTDHNDALTIRDAGWIIGFAESVQEAFDMTLQAYKIGEDKRVLLPVMIALDGFILSHTSEPVLVPEEEEVADWLPPREPLPFKVEPGKPFAVGNLGPDNVTMELRWNAWKAAERAKRVIEEVSAQYEKRFVTGTSSGLVERYETEGAKYLAISIGAWSGDVKEAVDALREEGYDVGLARIRYVRPFPREELRDLLSSVRAAVVLDRSVSMGHMGILGSEVRAVSERTPVKNVIAGIGGVDVSYKDFISILRGFVEEYEAGLSGEWSVAEWYMPWVTER